MNAPFLAVDIDHRMEGFQSRFRQFFEHPLLLASTAEEASLYLDLGSVENIAISIHEPLSEAFLRQCPKLKGIAVFGSSLKKLPMAFCKESNITVKNVVEYCDYETAEWVMYKILQFFREKQPARSVYEKSLGIVGMGAVGKHLAAMAQSFGMKVFYNSVKPDPTLHVQGVNFLNKEDLFARCDVVSLHTPSHVIWLSRELLRHAKKDLLIINTCMGRLSYEGDLEHFLNDRRDVSFLMDAIACPNYPELKERAIISKEQAFLTFESKERLVDKFFSNVKRLLKEETLREHQPDP